MDGNKLLERVKAALDDGELNLSAFHSVAYESMKASVKSCARDAMLWLIQNAPLSMLDGSDESTMPGCLDDTVTTGESVPASVSSIFRIGNVFYLPGDFVRLSRVRAEGWCRALRQTISDCDEEYLMLSDAVATSSYDRPCAVLIDSRPKRLELWPCEDEEVEITIVRHPSGTFAGLDSVNFNTAKIPIPPRLETPWVYMTCYLLLISWGDSRAKSYFEVVSSLLGLREDKNEK